VVRFLPAAGLPLRSEETPRWSTTDADSERAFFLKPGQQQVLLPATPTDLHGRSDSRGHVGCGVRTREGSQLPMEALGFWAPCARALSPGGFAMVPAVGADGAFTEGAPALDSRVGWGSSQLATEPFCSGVSWLVAPLRFALCSVPPSTSLLAGSCSRVLCITRKIVYRCPRVHVDATDNLKSSYSTRLLLFAPGLRAWFHGR
jgi:hypothetical protein